MSTRGHQPTTHAEAAAKGLADVRPAIVATGADAERARPVSFDRPLVEFPGLGDPRVVRQIAEAMRDARAKGVAEGYATGWAQGRRAAAEAAAAEAAERAEREDALRRQYASRAQDLLAALAATSRTVVEQAVPAWDELVEILLDGCLRILAAGLGRELSAVDAQAVEAARTALRILPGAQTASVHVNPRDAEVLGAATDLPAGVTVVPDAGVAEGTVVARTPMQSLPVDLLAALAAAEEVLRP